MAYVVLDSSIWISYLRVGADARLVSGIQFLLSEDRVATMGMIALEVLGGVRNEVEYRHLKEEFEALHWINITDSTWYSAARDAYVLRGKGLTAPFTDILIGRAALDAGCSLLHQDKHFDLIAKTTHLKIESQSRL